MLNKFNFKDMKFEKKLKIRFWTAALLAVFGAVTIGIFYYFDLFATTQIGHSVSFKRGLYFGTGVGILAGGIFFIIKNVSYLKTPAKFKEAEIAGKDERNRFIGNKIWSISGRIMLLLIYIGVVIAGIYSLKVYYILLTVLIVYGLVLFFVRLTIKKMY